MSTMVGMSLEVISQAAALLKARGGAAGSSHVPVGEGEHHAEVLAAVDFLTTLSELSRKAESALSTAEYGRAYACTTEFDAAVLAAGVSAPSLRFLQPLSERVMRASAKALQQLSGSLGRVCLVFDSVRYAEALQAFGSLEADASLSARVIGAYEAAVLTAVREYGVEVQTQDFDISFRGLLKKLTAFVQSLDTAILWHREGTKEASSVSTAIRDHVGGSRARFAISIVESVKRVLDSSAAPRRVVEAPVLVEVHELTTRFNSILEAFLRQSNESLEYLETKARAEASASPRKHSTEVLDGIPEVGVNFRFVPRRGRVAEGGGRLGKQLDEIGPGPLLRALSKWVSHHWDVLEITRMAEARILIADSSWLRPLMPRENLNSLQKRLSSACGTTTLSLSLQEAVDALKSHSKSMAKPAWMKIGVRTGLRGSESFTGCALDASEITLTPAAEKLLVLAADNHILCSSRIPELRGRCCRDAVQLLWLVLRASFELLPEDESQKSFSDVLSTSSMVRKRQLLAVSDHLPTALRSQLTALLTPTLECWDAHSPRDLTAACVAVECLLSMKALIQPWLLLLCEANTSANAGLDLRFVRVAFEICDSYAHTSYTLCCLAVACGELGVACSSVQHWGCSESGELPSEVSPYVKNHLQRCAEVLRLHPKLPLESSRKLDMALCQTTMDVLVDSYASLPASSASSRIQMLYDAQGIESGLEDATGMHPVPGADRLKQYIQAWFLSAEELQSWVDQRQRRLQLTEAHVEALLRPPAGDGDAGGVGGAGGPALRVMLSRAHSDFLGSFRSLLSGAEEEAEATFTIGDDSSTEG